MLKITFERPKIPIAESVQHIFEKKRRKKAKEEIKWGYKERVIVAVLLAVTVGLSLYFWYKSGDFPGFKIKIPIFTEKVVLERK